MGQFGELEESGELEELMWVGGSDHLLAPLLDDGLSGRKIAKPSTSLLLFLSAQTPELCKLWGHPQTTWSKF